MNVGSFVILLHNSFCSQYNNFLFSGKFGWFVCKYLGIEILFFSPVGTIEINGQITLPFSAVTFLSLLATLGANSGITCDMR
jgi:hypothetical protein